MSLLIPGTNSIKDTGYDVANSCRFNEGSNDHFSKTFGSSGNRRTWTWSCWLKRSELGRTQNFFSAGSGGNYARIQFNSDDTIYSAHVDGASTTTERQTSAKFRDVSSWMHIVWHLNTTSGTESLREKLYINGVEITDFSTNTIPSQNYEDTINENVAHYIGNQLGAYEKMDCYMAECVFIDGQALDPTSFGEFDDDSPTIWKPIDVSGLTFGSNGFHLDFEDSSTLGNDVSGNNNDFTTNNLTSVDQSLDTCTNNYCTANYLNNFYAQSTFYDGLLGVTTTTSNNTYNMGTFGVSKGKWYYEVKIVDSSSNGTIGVGWIASNPTSTSDQMKNKSNQSTYRDNGTIFANGSEVVTGSSLANNDIVGVYFDADNNFVYFAKNGDLQNSGNPTSGSSGTGGFDPGLAATATTEGFYFPAMGDHSGGQNIGVAFNFGSPAYAVSSGNSDANGHGNFEYAVPSGYFTLCSKNIGEFG